MTRFSVLAVPAAVLSLVLLILLSGCRKQDGAGASPPDVEVASIQQKDVPIYSEVVGTLQADVNATISAQVGGYLLRRDYDEGHLVKQGDLLFEIDDRTYQATLDQAQAKLRKTELDVQRYRPLAATEAISQQELDDAIQANLAAKAAADEARLNVQFCKITSPINGVAGLAQAQIGDLVGPNTGPLTTVVQTDPMRVHFSVSQEIMIQVAQRMLAAGQKLRSGTNGMPLELVLASGNPYPLKGQIRYADNQVDVRTGTIRIVGEFPNPNGLLVPGMFVRVRVLLDTDKDALLVPQQAVMDVQGRSLIAVVGADNHVSILPVQTGSRVGSQWVIRGNVKAGDRIVAEGIQKVRDGVVVNPLPWLDKTAADPAAPATEQAK
ncbi:MAG TPA: efflux RND transporter periplasmic adaptor subunit [Candidatus Acidoferrales bacterium]|nr:efflux RND transporter periplasmic adaptor subunit [Candidatus Acidoferrales bacterium]